MISIGIDSYNQKRLRFKIGLLIENKLGKGKAESD
jgi:hypothetical protein